MQKVIEKISQNKKLTIVAIITFVISLLYNIMSPYTTDDYSYMYSAVTGEKVTNIFQILVSLWDDYFHVNGRLLPHFFLQILLIGPKWIFNLINAAMYVWLLWLMQRMNSSKKEIDVMLWIATAVGLWVFLPAYGQVFLWMTGSINYSWCFVFSLIYISFYIKLLKHPQEILKKGQFVGFYIYSFFFGAYSAQLSFATVFVSFLLLCVVVMSEKAVKKYLVYVIPVVMSALGYITMILSPAESGRVPELSLGIIVKSILSIFETYYLGAKILLGIWAVLLVLAICFNVERKEIVISVAFMLISIISIVMLFAASYVVGRHYANADFFIVMAIIVLMQSLIGKGKIGCVAYCLCAYLLATNVWTLWEGTYDIYDTYKKQQLRDEYVYEQIQHGNKEIVYVKKILPSTKYSCKYDLIDLQTDEQEIWPNYAIAAYYGVEEIYGIE